MKHYLSVLTDAVGVVHIEAPLIFLSIDTPRRDPRDVIFVKPEDGTPESFIQANQIK